MMVIIGTVTADLLVQSQTPLATLGGDGFRQSNLVFTDAPVTISMGGNGGNSAYVLAGLGEPTALCGAVGQDVLGDRLVALLEAQQVDLTGLARSASSATSTSTIIMSDAANQAVFHHLGATAEVQFEAMPERLLETAVALLATSFPIMPKLRSAGFAQALARVKAAGGLTALDIGPAIGKPVALAELTPLLPTVDYLIANTHELMSLVETAPSTNSGQAVWQNGAEKLLAAGAHHLIIKQGEQGAAAWTTAKRIHVPGFEVETQVSVGAGDSFNVGFLWALKEKRPLAKALRFGNAVAALVVSSPRGVLDSPTLAQVEAFLDEHR
jgi:ribokinase